MTDLPVDTLAGRVLAGRYRLDRVVATGGMAQVWEGTDQVLARQVAVKVLHPHLAADATFVARFRREAVAAARLSHPSIISIYDTVSSDGVEAIVMELVKGQTLRECLDEHRYLEPAHAVAIVTQVADALEIAHRAGLVHRDIKPANILLSDDGRVLVADFGIAKAGEDLTTTNATLGTATYLAPEQVEGGDVDARADVYALGVVLYETMCGRPPFRADTEAGTALARLHTEPMRPRNIRAGIPRQIEDVVLRAMARDPAARFQSASSFRAALVAANGGTVVDAPVLTGGAEALTAAVAAVDRTPTGEAPPTFVRTERGWLVPVLIIVIIAIALAVGGLVVTGNTNKIPAIGDAGPAPVQPVSITGAVAFDPAGDKHENDADAPKAVDGNPSTVWQTEGYNSRTVDVKPGVGLVVALDASGSLQTLTVNSPSNGWAADIYVTTGMKSDLNGFGQPVTSKDDIASGDATFDLGGHKGDTVLIWLTNLGDDGPRYHGRIAEVSVTAS